MAEESSTQSKDTDDFLSAPKLISPASAPAGVPARQKVPLGNGFGLADWTRMIRTGADMSGGLRSQLRVYSLDEVAKHNKLDDCWMIIRGKVYNVTAYIPYHPGGVSELMRGAGRDATEVFNEVHAWVNLEFLMSPCHIGFYNPALAAPAAGSAASRYPMAPPPARSASLLAPPGAGSRAAPLKPAPSGGSAATALSLPTTTTAALASPFSPDEWRWLTLHERRQETHDTVFLRFALPQYDAPSSIPAGSHLELRVQTDTDVVTRPYTPITPPGGRGFVDFVIKLYPTGRMSRAIAPLRVGERVAVRGPVSRFEYSSGKQTALAMVAGGSGITPMYQLLMAVAGNATDRTALALVYANHTEEDILLRRQLDLLAQSGRARVTHVLSRPSDTWQGASGHITAELLAASLPAPGADVQALICGPPSFVTVALRLLREMGYTDSNIFVF